MLQRGERMDLLGKRVIQLFPTCLFTGKISDTGACDQAEKKLRELRKSGCGTFDRSAYVTPDDIWKLDELRTIVDLIMMESNEVLNFYKVKRDSHYYRICGPTLRIPIIGTICIFIPIVC